MKQRIKYLLKRCQDDSLTPEEREELAMFLQEEENRELFNREAGHLIEDSTPAGAADNVVWEPLLENILNADKLPVKEKTPVIRLKWWWYAAAIVFIIAVSGLLFRKWNGTPHRGQPGMMAATGIGPGGNKAILTLANGRSITLADAQNGVVGLQSGTQVVKLDSGYLAYQPGKAVGDGEAEYNTLTIPRGGQFRVMLPDSTVVWLNAASTLKYPVVFTAKQRTVELSGEAYFEVKAAPDAPFRVKTKGMEVAVLGTHFNVNAYGDNNFFYVTLLEGAVKVQGKDEPVVLSPGQQANVDGAGSIQIKQADTAQVMAWKNGFFEFKGADVNAVFSQLTRWYNITVRYEGDLSSRRFVGKIPRTYNLDEVLTVLQESDIHFRIEGDKVIVLP